MRIKAILRSLLFSYAFTGIALLFLALLLFTLNLGESAVTVGIVMVYVLSCLMGGFLTGKMIRKNRYLWGLCTGVVYFALLVMVSFAVQGKWDMTVSHAITTFLVCTGGGALGGMLS